MATQPKGTTLGAYLRELRTEKGLSLKELAEACNVDLSLFSKIEHGERSLSLDMIPALATALDIDFKTLQIDLMAMRLAEDFGKEEYATGAFRKALKNISLPLSK
jgi:HTH-type transcriptional regulator, competence development regulator